MRTVSFDAQQVAGALFVGLEAVDADDDLLALLDHALRVVGRILDLAVDKAFLDGLERAAQFVDLGDVFLGAALDLVGQRLDVDRSRPAGRPCRPSRSRRR